MIGEQIGQYKLVQAIGQGGMATVYKAYQAAFDRYVAIKVLSRQFSDDPTFVKRFQREARVVARIEHRSIVPMYDYGEEHNLYYIVMRLIEGGTLRKKMYYEDISLPTAARILQQIAEALDYAHQHDVIHRDMKPSNILLDERGNAYLTDFGIAKMLGSNTQVTQSGVVGTPSYMSPEQCQGKELTPASDIYSLGAILFEVLTGSVPYESDTPLSVMYMHVRDPIPSAREIEPSLPPAIDRVFMRALAKRPQERYPTAVAMIADFREVAGIPDEPLVRPPEAKKSLLGSLFKRPAPSPAAPLVIAPSVPQAVVEEPRTVQHQPAAEDEPTPNGASPALEELTPARQPRSLSQTFLAGAIGVLALVGLTAAGIFGISALGKRGGSVLAPTLPPSATAVTATPGDLPTQTAIYVIVTSEGPTATTFSGGIIEPSATPTLAAIIAPLGATPLPTNTQPPPTATLPPPTATSPPPTNTAIPPTNTAPPPPPPGRIAYTEGINTAAEIVVMDTSGQNRQQLTNNNQYDGEPDWSPDGSRIAFEAMVGSDTDIYSMAANGADIRRLTSANEPNRHPDWSPNGALIAYESGKDDGTEIYVMNADGSSPARLTNNTYGDRAPKFSPDGTKIAYMTDQRGKWEIAVMAYPGASVLGIYDCPAFGCRFPAWSPDGSKIAYNTWDSQQTESGIWVLDAVTGQSTSLLKGTADGRPTWSGDGKAIFFNRSSGSETDIYRLTLPTGEVVRLTFSTKEAYGPDWGP